MKTSHRISMIVAATAFAAIAGCGSTPTRESTGQYLDDSVITTKVKASLVNDPELKSGEISVETYKGIVQLSGFVSSQTMMDKAVADTQHVRGVVSVSNDMRLK